MNNYCQCENRKSIKKQTSLYLYSRKVACVFGKWAWKARTTRALRLGHSDTISHSKCVNFLLFVCVFFFLNLYTYILVRECSSINSSSVQKAAATNLWGQLVLWSIMSMLFIFQCRRCSPDLIFCHVIFVYEISLVRFDRIRLHLFLALLSPIHSTLLDHSLLLPVFFCSYQCNNGMAKLTLLSIYFYYNSTASLELVVLSVMHHNEVMQFKHDEHDLLFLSSTSLHTSTSLCAFCCLFSMHSFDLQAHLPNSQWPNRFDASSLQKNRLHRNIDTHTKDVERIHKRIAP